MNLRIWVKCLNWEGASFSLQKTLVLSLWRPRSINLPTFSFGCLWEVTGGMCASCLSRFLWLPQVATKWMAKTIRTFSLTVLKARIPRSRCGRGDSSWRLWGRICWVFLSQLLVVACQSWLFLALFTTTFASGVFTHLLLCVTLCPLFSYAKS